MRRKTRRLRGGNCDTGTCQLPQSGGQRTGLMNPTWGGGGCGCASPAKPIIQLPVGVSQGPLTLGLLTKGGGCGCRPVPPIPTAMGGYKASPKTNGGYRPTKRDLKYLKLWRQGKSIGFTMRSSLKAKGLIPRANGTKRVSAKYRK